MHGGDASKSWTRVPLVGGLQEPNFRYEQNSGQPVFEAIAWENYAHKATNREAVSLEVHSRGLLKGEQDKVKRAHSAVPVEPNTKETDFP